MLQKCKNYIFSKSVPPCEKKDDYYFSIERVYGISGVILLICTGVFVLMSIIFGYRELTYENIYYFIKDFDTVIKSDNYNAVVIDYGVGDDRSYSCYRGGIVAAEKYSASVYSVTGRTTATFSNNYSKPIVRSSSKYVLIYDSDGTGFSIYNSFILLHAENIGHRIYSADINDVGDALIHTEAAGYGSALYLYDHNFERAAAYYFNDYVTCSALSNDGRQILVSTGYVDGASYISQFKVYQRGEFDAFSTYDVYNEISLACGQLEGGGYYLVTYRGVRIFDADWNVLVEYIAPAEHSFIDFDECENGIAVSAQNGNEYVLTYVPLVGEELTLRLDSKPLSFCCNENSAYVLYDGAIAKYNFTVGTYKLLDCAPGGVDLLVMQGNRVFLCYPSRAVCIEF